MRDFTYNGVTLSSFGGRILQKPSHTVARRNIDRVKIYGQSGDEIIDNESYDNVDFSLKVCFLPHLTPYSAQELSQRVINWLAPLQNSYYVYRDTYNPGYFTKAVLTNFDEVVRELLTLLTATLKFTRVPFWYSDAGASSVTGAINGSVTVTNPENYDAEPIITAMYRGSANYNVFFRFREGNTIIYESTLGGIWPKQILDGVAKQHYVITNTNERKYIDSALPSNIPAGGSVTYSGTFGTGASPDHSFTIYVTPNWRRL